jgi:hypothetical protein
LVLSWVAPAFAQQTGTLSGLVVHDGTVKPVVGAVVRVKDTSIETVSGSGGRFVLRDVPSGEHTLLVEYMGAPSFQQTLTVDPGGTTRHTIELRSGEEAADQVVVMGRATGRARALNMQRAAENVVNIISADNIGNFPDYNAAEALVRIPGISIVRNRGEGRYVNIRGLGADLNAYSVDGLALAAPGDGERAIALV